MSERGWLAWGLRAGSGRHRWMRWTAGLLLSVVGVAGQAPKLRIAGSDVLGPPVVALLEKWAADFEEEIAVDFDGTRLALDRVSAGEAAMALLLDYPTAPALPETWMSVPLGHVVVLVVAPEKAPIEQIGFADLAKIFGASSAVATLRWGDLGGVGDWTVEPVVPFVTDGEGGMAEPIFRHVVLRDGALKAGVTRHRSAPATLAAAAREVGALAIVPRLPAEVTGFKVLLVSAWDDQVAFGPTAENLAVGDYPLRLELRLAFPRAQAGPLLEWLRLWHSEQMASALEACGVLPLAAPVRNQQVFDLELLN